MEVTTEKPFPKERLLIFPIHFIVGADIEQDDFLFGDVQGKGYAVAVSDSYRMVRRMGVKSFNLTNNQWFDIGLLWQDS